MLARLARIRPTEVDALIGDPSKAKTRLGWAATIDAPQLARIMVDADITALKSEPTRWIDEPALPEWPRLQDIASPNA